MGIFVEFNNFGVLKRLIFFKVVIYYGVFNYMEMIWELKEYYEMICEKIVFMFLVMSVSIINEWVKGGRLNYEVGEVFVELWKIFIEKID